MVVERIDKYSTLKATVLAIYTENGETRYVLARQIWWYLGCVQNEGRMRRSASLPEAGSEPGEINPNGVASDH